MRFTTLLISLIFILSGACKSNKTGPVETIGEEACLIEAEVQDFSGLDGCGKILVTTDGYKILPFNPKVLEPYSAENSVRISYEKKSEMASTCMAEDFIADITCIKLESKPRAKECIDSPDIKGLKWLSGSPTNQIFKIDKYSFLEDGWSYIITSESDMKKVYNCQGELLCFYTDAPDEGCKLIINDMYFLKNIYSRSSTK